MHFEAQRGEYVVSTDPARLDAAAIRDYLARSYWAREIPLEVVRRSLAHSLCFGLYRRPSADGTAGGEAQVGLARVISDFATFAYLCDVYVLEAHRGRGLSKWLVEAVLAHPDLRGLRRFCLATLDAHGLYARYGFQVTAHPDRWMEIIHSNPYSSVE